MTEQGKANKIAYIKQYQRKNYRCISFKLRYGQDDDIISLLKSKPSASEFIKKLLRESAGK